METRNVTCNKVYINPNFHGPRQAVSIPQSKVHINPLFSHDNKIKEIKKSACQSQTIHINPNFVNAHPMTSFHNTGPVESYNEINEKQMNSITNATIKTDENDVTSDTIAKSKYRLVRKHVKTKIETPNITRNIFKINRYKIAPITTVTVEDRKYTKPVRYQYLQDTSIKNISNNLKSTSKYNILKRKRQTSSIINDNGLSRSGYSEKTFIKKIYSKNCIPCPLFRKYGKCIRHEKGNCKFVHDKKHVSVCRKFLQGKCQNKDCVFSHEITTKKMPTCSFYLKGICTKTDCPYLHVKLNENTNICNDFQKGYCEKGEQCLKRHIESSCNVSRKRILGTTHMTGKPSTTKRLKRSASKITDNSITIEDDAEKRYYKTTKHSKSAVDNCKVIKPTRCKLGDLPSFISL